MDSALDSGPCSAFPSPGCRPASSALFSVSLAEGLSVEQGPQAQERGAGRPSYSFHPLLLARLLTLAWPLPFPPGLSKDDRDIFLHPSCVTCSLVSSFQVKFFYLCQLAYWLHALPELYFQKVRKVSTHFSLWKPFVLPSPLVPSGPLSLPRQAQSIGW